MIGSLNETMRMVSRVSSLMADAVLGFKIIPEAVPMLRDVAPESRRMGS
jgi:hypothetical protein